ncbi:hypothetical protein [Aeromonas salmonicida]
MNNSKESKILGLLLSKYAAWGVVALLILAVIPSYVGVPKPWNDILLSLGTSIFILLTISYYVNETIKFHTNNELKDLVHSKFPILVDMEKDGLVKAVYSNQLKSVGIDIERDDIISIVMNDGKNFISNNSGELSARFKLAGKITNIIFLNPDSNSQAALCERNGKEQDHYKIKIRDSIKTLNDYKRYGNENHILNIYFYDHYFALNVVITPRYAVIGTYRNSTGKFEAPPSYIYSSNGHEYINIKCDVDRLIENSKIVSPNKSSQQEASQAAASA